MRDVGRQGLSREEVLSKLPNLGTADVGSDHDVVRPADEFLEQGDERFDFGAKQREAR